MSWNRYDSEGDEEEIDEDDYDDDYLYDSSNYDEDDGYENVSDNNNNNGEDEEVDEEDEEVADEVDVDSLMVSANTDENMNLTVKSGTYGGDVAVDRDSSQEAENLGGEEEEEEEEEEAESPRIASNSSKPPSMDWSVASNHDTVDSDEISLLTSSIPDYNYFKETLNVLRSINSDTRSLVFDESSVRYVMMANGFSAEAVANRDLSNAVTASLIHFLSTILSDASQVRNIRSANTGRSNQQVAATGSAQQQQPQQPQQQPQQHPQQQPQQHQQVSTTATTQLPNISVVGVIAQPSQQSVPVCGTSTVKLSQQSVPVCGTSTVKLSQSTSAANKKNVLTMEDLTLSLKESGIEVSATPYFF